MIIKEFSKNMPNSLLHKFIKLHFFRSKGYAKDFIKDCNNLIYYIEEVLVYNTAIIVTIKNSKISNKFGMYTLTIYYDNPDFYIEVITKKTIVI